MEGVAVGVGQPGQRERRRAASAPAVPAHGRVTAVMRSPSTSIDDARLVGCRRRARPARTKSRRRHEPTRRDELGDAVDERVAVVALELLPRRERARVVTRSRKSMPSRWSHSCWNVPAVRPRLTSSCAHAVAVEARTRTLTWRITLPRRFGHRQAALVDLDQLVVDRLDHRVDHDGQRDRRLVRVARVVVDLDRRRCAPARAPGWRRARRRWRRASCRSGRRSAAASPATASSSAVTSRARSRSTGCPTVAISRTVTRQPLPHRDPHAPLVGHLDRPVVAGVGVADHARAGVGGEHPFELLRRRARCRRRRTTMPGMDRAADADAAAVVDAHPCRAAGVLTSALSSGQSAIASEPSAIASVSR